MAISQTAAERLAKVRARLAQAVEPSEELGLMDQINSIQPRTQAVVCIVVAATNGIELETLPRTLDQLSRQTGSVKFEVCLFLNRPAGTAPDATIEIARDAQRCYSNLTIHILEAEIPRDKLTIGYIRSQLHAAVSEKARQADIQDLIHVIIDADMVWLHPNLIEAHCRKLKETCADACIGQLDWDHPLAPTAEIPALIVGSAVMRLIPKYASKRLIDLAARGEKLAPGVLEEAIFATDNFGVFANVSIRDEVYRRVGGYQPLIHAEDCEIMQRIWESGRHRNEYGSLCFGWEQEGIAVTSSSRRALWALHTERLPAVRQWDHVDYRGPGGHGQLPDLTSHRRAIPDTAYLMSLINESLVAFPLPPTALQHAISSTLKEMGLSENHYAVNLNSANNHASTAEITITDDAGLRSWLHQQMRFNDKAS